MAGSFATRRTFLKAAAAAPAALALPSAVSPASAAVSASTTAPGNPVIDWDINAQSFIWDVAKEQPQVQ